MSWILREAGRSILSFRRSAEGCKSVEILSEAESAPLAIYSLGPALTMDPRDLLTSLASSLSLDPTCDGPSTGDDGGFEMLAECGGLGGSNSVPPLDASGIALMTTMASKMIFFTVTSSTPCNMVVPTFAPKFVDTSALVVSPMTPSEFVPTSRTIRLYLESADGSGVPTFVLPAGLLTIKDFDTMRVYSRAEKLHHTLDFPTLNT